jgi:osmotically-inducible protein OsmY
MTADRALQESVLTELSSEPSIDAAHIGVMVDGGVVSLSGHVENFLQKRNAEMATARVRGVRAVVEGLEVRMPVPLKQRDEVIAKAALNRLDSEVNVPKNVVTITVENGWVTLTGRAGWHFQRQAAERVLRGLVGVVGIQNEMTTNAHPIEAEVTAEIDAALHRSRFEPRRSR